ncbi:MAG: hypothetical protein ACFFDW_16225, partial [Candidatus Thorarchaeota archaeon]
MEAQEEIGKEATKDWSGFGQTPASRLKQIYSRDNFDPETKYYAFKDDKLVGFITSTILPEKEGEVKRANLELPIVLKEHKECSDLLFKQLVSTLKQKSVKIVQTRVGDIYKGTQELAKKYGYSYAKDLYILMETKVNKIPMEKTSDIEIMDYDAARDSKELKKIIIEKLGAPEEQANATIERLEKERERYPVLLVMYQENHIVGTALAYPNEKIPKQFRFGLFYCENEKNIKPLVFALVNKIKAYDVESIIHFLSGPTL